MALDEHYFSRNPSSQERQGLIQVRLRGLDLEFFTTSGVFSYKRIDKGTRLLVDSMMLPDFGRVLDMGCGYGVVGIVAARLKPGVEVWMTDVNERAISLAKRNLERNGVTNAKVKQGNLYRAVKETSFRAILSNPPISAGMHKVVEPLVAGAAERLEPGGSLQLVVQSNKGGRALASMMETHFGCVEVLARGSGYRVLLSEK